MGSPLPINQPPYYNTDQIANSIAADDMYDCYLETVPGVGLVTRRRPGLLAFATLTAGQPGQGMYYWEARDMLIAVAGGRIYNIHSDGGVFELTGARLDNKNPVTFADGQDTGGSPYLYMANGKFAYTQDGMTAVYPTDSNAPSTATHVAWLNSRFIANSAGTNRFLFTDTDPATGILDPTYWSATENPVTCDAKGDNLTCLFSAWNEIYAWGTEGLQIFQDDGVSPYSNIPGAFAECGMEAPYSVARCDNTIFALCVVDSKRAVVKLQGRTPQVVSEPIANVLSGLSTVSDAIGGIISVGGLAIYLLQFPTADQTWAYDFKNDTWCRWGKYYGDADNRQRFMGQFPVFVKTWNKHLIMSRENGAIYELSREAYTDAGTPCLPYRRTGWTDFGAPGTRKQCSSLYITGKPGLNNNAKLLMRWRDDGYQPWSSYIEMSFKNSMVEPLNRMGTFRTRQYEFRIPDGADTVLISAVAEGKELKN